MPSTSKKQADFMRAVAHSPEFAKKAGVPQSVGKEFSNADKGRKFSKGGDMKSENMMMKKEGRGMAKADLAKHAAMPASKAHKGLKAGGSVGTTKMGAVKTASPSRDGVATKGKTKGTMIKMARGGKAC
jgi:predicted transcriptional regulator